MKKYFLLVSLILLASCSTSEMRNTQNLNNAPILSGEIQKAWSPYEIGSVDTAFQLIGPDHQVEVGGVPDPKVVGVTCFYSRAKKWGITGGLGLATDTSDASVACRQTSKIQFTSAIKPVEEIWNESSSLLFKKIRIVRFYDIHSNSLIYLVYSDKLIDGSPKNSISAVALEDIRPTLEK